MSKLSYGKEFYVLSTDPYYFHIIWLLCSEFVLFELWLVCVYEKVMKTSRMGGLVNARGKALCERRVL